MSAVIAHAVSAGLVTTMAASRRMTVELRYDRGDPLAVRAVFPATVSLDGTEAVWTFSRELLAAGLRTHAGEGEVRLWPHGPAVTRLALHTAEGVALVELSTVDVRSFLETTYRGVPRGAEVVDSALESGLAALLRSV